jgi:hypothetical protein
LGPNTTQIERQIAETRDDIESTIVQLRERSRATLRRGAVFALAALAVGAAVGAGLVAWRLMRPPTVRERINRVIPIDLDWLGELRRRLDLNRRLPPIRLYVGDRAVGESPPETTVERLLIKAAQAAGTAAAAALVSRVVNRMRSRRREE